MRGSIVHRRACSWIFQAAARRSAAAIVTARPSLEPLRTRCAAALRHWLDWSGDEDERLEAAQADRPIGPAGLDSAARDTAAPTHGSMAARSALGTRPKRGRTGSATIISGGETRMDRDGLS